MQLTIDATDLKNALQLVAPLTRRRSTLPILGNVLLECDGERLVATATDLDARLSIRVDAEIKTAGTIALPCGLLLNALAFMSGAVTLTIDDKHVATIKASGRTLTLHGLAADDFPLADAITDPKTIALSPEFVRAVKKVVEMAATPDQARPNLEGVYLESDSGKLVAATSNGRCLSVFRTEIPASGVKAMIPTTAARMLVALPFYETLAMRLTDSALEWTTYGWTLQSKVGELRFPEWKSLIPEQSKGFFQLPMQELRASLRFAVQEAKTQPAVTFAVNDESVSISNATESAQSHSEISRTGGAGSIEFTMSPVFLGRALDACEADAATISFTDRSSPFVVSEGNYTSVLMPMRVS
jgi:DNA polymerase-3 subunit beta